MPILVILAMVPVMVIAVPARAAGQHTLLSPYRERQSSEIRGLSAEEIIHGHQHGHSHNVYHEHANIIPGIKVTSVKDGDVLSGLVVVESYLEGERKGYGDEVGYGVRYYLDNTLVQEEFYDRRCNGKFSYTIDTTAYLDGEYTLYVGMCDHHQHVTSRGYRIKIANSPQGKR